MFKLKYIIPIVILAAGLVIVISQISTGSSKRVESATAEDYDGTSVVVLIDFSKSFAAHFDSEGNVKYGFNMQDKRALEEMVDCIADMATEWKPPIKVVWAPIETSSINLQPICSPFQSSPSLIKKKGKIGSKEEVLELLNGCVDSVIQFSTNYTNLSNYTDISSAVLMASQMSPGKYDKRIIVIFSDFIEDLKPGVEPPLYSLNGEHIILAHRPGIDERQTVQGYLSRINEWKSSFISKGAKSVSAYPVFAITNERTRAILNNEAAIGTNLTILVDLKDGVYSSLHNGTTQNLLNNIGHTLSDYAEEWDPPVYTHWVIAGSNGYNSTYMPTIVYEPSLISKEGKLSTIDDYKVAMDEVSEAVKIRGHSTSISNISGSLALASFIDPPTTTNYIILISDFNQPELFYSDQLELGPNSTIIMIHTAASSDESNPNNYLERIGAWKENFLKQGAARVHSFPLQSFTDIDLQSCFEN